MRRYGNDRRGRGYHRGRGGGRGGGRGRGGRGPRRSYTEESSWLEELGDSSGPCVSIAIEGCCHGELDRIYDRLMRHQETTGKKIDLLLCCGDFQSLRNSADFHSMAVPHKYRALGSFYRYYSGEMCAPIPTVFIGGNHEASQYLSELPYGGWVAPNIYYMGYTGVIRFNNLRIGGISGIYASHDYTKGRFEEPPYDRSTLRSVYHVRNVDVYRMKCLATNKEQSPLDVMLSHDWPQGIEQHGKTKELIRMKPFFRNEIDRNDLGSPANKELLDALQPRWWFAAHLHVKFRATVTHKNQAKESNKKNGEPSSLVPSQAISSSDNNGDKTEQDGNAKQAEGLQATNFVAMESRDPCLGPDLTEQMTRFLSLDKCLPGRQYMSVVHVPVAEKEENPQLEYDAEWLAIIKKTHNLTQTTQRSVSLPDTCQTVTENEIQWIRDRFGASLVIPDNFEPTMPAHVGSPHPLPHPLPPPFPKMGNPQTDQLLERLDLKHINTMPHISPEAQRFEADDNEIMLDDDGVVLAMISRNPDSAKEPTAPAAEDDNEIDLDDEGGAEMDATRETALEGQTNKATQSHYEAHQSASSYEEAYFYEPGAYMDHLCTLVKKRLCLNETTTERMLLDIGGGTGNFTKMIVEGSDGVTAVVVDPFLIDEEALSSNQDQHRNDKVRFVKAPAENFKDPPEQNDMWWRTNYQQILLKEVLHHIRKEDRVPMLRGMYEGIQVSKEDDNTNGQAAPSILIITRPQVDIDYPLWDEAKQVWAEHQPALSDFEEELAAAGFRDIQHTLEVYPCSIRLDRWQTMVKTRVWSTFANFSDEELEKACSEMAEKEQHRIDSDGVLRFEDRLLFISARK